jgi:hypothetical protein
MSSEPKRCACAPRGAGGTSFPSSSTSWRWKPLFSQMNGRVVLHCARIPSSETPRSICTATASVAERFWPATQKKSAVPPAARTLSYTAAAFFRWSERSPSGWWRIGYVTSSRLTFVWLYSMPASSYASSGSPRIPIDAQLSTADTPSRLITSTSIAWNLLPTYSPSPTSDGSGSSTSSGVGWPTMPWIFRIRSSTASSDSATPPGLTTSVGAAPALAPPRHRIGFASSDAVRDGEPVSVCAEMGIIRRAQCFFAAGRRASTPAS